MKLEMESSMHNKTFGIFLSNIEESSTLLRNLKDIMIDSINTKKVLVLIDIILKFYKEKLC